MKACRLGHTRGTHTWAEGGQEPEATLPERREVGWVRAPALPALSGTRLVFKWEVLHPGNPAQTRALWRAAHSSELDWLEFALFSPQPETEFQASDAM